MLSNQPKRADERRAQAPPRLVGLESHPGGSLAMLTAPAPATRHAYSWRNEPIEVYDDDNDDADEISYAQHRKDQSIKQLEARQHLNDHVPQSVHPNLDQPLFQSSFDTSSQWAASSSTVVASSSVSPRAPSPMQTTLPVEPSTKRTPALGQRPNVSFAARPRSYKWTGARPSSPGSTSPSSADSASSRKVHRSGSSSSLRSRREEDRQIKALEKRYLTLKAEGSEFAPAFERVHHDAVTGMQQRQETRRKDTRAAGPRFDFYRRESQAKLGLDKDGAFVDMRQELDHIISKPTEPQFKPPKRVTPRPHTPADFVPYKSEYLRRMDQELEDEKRRAKERARPAIPRALAPEQDTLVTTFLNDSSFQAVIGNAPVDSGSLRRLQPSVWLNDEIVNAYAELLNSRAKSEGRKVHCMNSFFYQKLSEQGYAGANLKRWTKRAKVDIFSLDQFLVPINVHNSHWVCATINFARKQVEYFDSLPDSGNRHTVFAHLREYLQAEHKEKKGSSFDLSGWKDHFDPKTPKQNNASDCGVFSCQTLEAVARGCDMEAGFEFSQENMPFFRRLMVLEIASEQLSDRAWGRGLPKL